MPTSNHSSPDLTASRAGAHGGVLTAIRQRRSQNQLGEPAPSRQQLETMVQATLTVPDHGQLKPYRWVIVEAHRRQAFADALEANGLAYNAELGEEKRAALRKKAFQSPMPCLLVFSPTLEGTSIPLWEQQASASCAGYAMTLAAEQLGFGAVWKSMGFPILNPLKAFAGLQEYESLLGWIHLGSVLKARGPRPSLHQAQDFISFT